MIFADAPHSSPERLSSRPLRSYRSGRCSSGRCGIRYASGALLLAVLFTGGRSAAAAADPASPTPVAADSASPATPPAAAPAGHVSPAAQQLLDQMKAAYGKLSSLSETVHFRESGAQTVEMQTSFAIKRPSEMVAVMSIGNRTIRTVSDGKHLLAFDSANQHRYFKLDAAPQELVLLQVAQARLSNLGLLPSLFTTKDPLSPLRAGIVSLDIGVPDRIDGVPVDVVTGPMTPGPGATGTISIAIGRDDHLLRQVTIQLLSPPERVGILTETHTDVKVNPVLDHSIFGMEAPAGAVAITTLGPPQYDPKLTQGARPTPFTAHDRNGRTVTLDQFKGKVLLLEFWGSQYKISHEEAPALLALYKQYHPQGLEILGVSMDDASTRDDMNTFIKDEKLPWTQVFDSKGWTGVVPSLYQVKVIPFDLLIGRNGKITDVDVHGQDLEDAIKLALAH